MAVKKPAVLEKLTLERCTKAQLIQLIKWLDPKGIHTDSYLIDLHSQQAFKTLDKMDKLVQKSCEVRKRAAEILKPYEGKLYSEIPFSVLTQAEALIVEADKLQEKWARLSRRVG